MALLHFDGFESYGSAADMANQGWATTSGSPTITVGRRSGVAVVNTLFSRTRSIASGSSFVMGLACAAAGASWSGASFVELREGSTVHVGVARTTNNALIVYRGTTATILAQSADNILPAATNNSDPNNYIYIELKATIHDTTGSFELRINGSNTALLSGTNVDTRNGGTGVADTVAIGTTFRVDDFYICDTTGAAPHNDFLGDCRIDVCRPNADGNYTAFAASAGARWDCVDEATPSSADYVFSSTVGDRVSFGKTDLPASSSTTVYGVRVTGVALKDDAGGRSANLMVRSGSTDLDGTALALTTTAAGLPQMLLTTDPATSAAWTVAGVNALEIGARVSA